MSSIGTSSSCMPPSDSESVEMSGLELEFMSAFDLLISWLGKNESRNRGFQVEQKGVQPLNCYNLQWLA
jgi:hypothetical protein